MFHRRHRDDFKRPARPSRRPGRRADRKSGVRFWPGLEGLEGRVVLSFAAPVNYAAGASISSVAVGDFNGDGRADIIAANESPGTVSVLLNNGDGTFAAPIATHTGNTPVVVEADHRDGDGKEDIVVLGSYYPRALP